MGVAVVLTYQAVAPFVAPFVASLPAPSLDLHVAVPVKCGATGDEIVVCGSPTANEQYRLRPLPDKYVAPPFRAETKLFGDATGGVGAQQEAFSNGQVSKQVKVTIRVPF